MERTGSWNCQVSDMTERVIQWFVQGFCSQWAQEIGYTQFWKSTSHSTPIFFHQLQILNHFFIKLEWRDTPKNSDNASIFFPKHMSSSAFASPDHTGIHYSFLFLCQPGIQSSASEKEVSHRLVTICAITHVLCI